jgi:hypothetical protein
MPRFASAADPLNYSCVGKQFAYQEMRLFIATILWKYHMSFKAGFDSVAWEEHVKDNGTLLEIHEPLEVVLTSRKPGGKR